MLGCGAGQIEIARLNHSRQRLDLTGRPCQAREGLTISVQEANNAAPLAVLRNRAFRGDAGISVQPHETAAGGAGARGSGGDHRARPADHEVENRSTDDPRPTSPTRVVFTSVTVLKGTFLGELDVPGHLESQDDPNESPFPYTFVRPGGRHGNCYALGYRQGAEYLLFLNGDQSKPGTLTPYWSPLSPTNEQLFSDTDRWLRWVTRELATAVRGADGRPSAVLVRRDPVIPGRAAAGR